jgi:hypothetical protein
MDSTLKWSQNDFREEYAEAVEEARQFAEFALDAFRGCSANDDPAIALESYRKADLHHHATTERLARLALRFCKKTANRPLDRWTVQERENNDLIRSLAGMLSGVMNNMLPVHKISLQRAQDLKMAAEREDDCAS